MTNLISTKWRDRKITKKQLDYIGNLLKTLGLKSSDLNLPETRGAASIFIMSLLKRIYGGGYFDASKLDEVKVVYTDLDGVALDPQPEFNQKDRIEYFSLDELKQKKIID